MTVAFAVTVIDVASSRPGRWGGGLLDSIPQLVIVDLVWKNILVEKEDVFRMLP